MLVISIYGLSIIYSDWQEIKLIQLKVKITDEQRNLISDVEISLDQNLAGKTDALGELTSLISKPGNIFIRADKYPYTVIDTTIFLPDSGLDVSFQMRKPFASLSLMAFDESGAILADAKVMLNRKESGQTDENGVLLIRETLRLLDSVEVKLTKDGFDNLTDYIYLANTNQEASFVLNKKAKAAPAKPKPVAKPKPDFQSYFNKANQYLDRAISGDMKYYGRALSEINSAISTRPKYVPAKQLKVEILFNFAKSLQSSKLLNEAANRCGEALKVYRDMPQDQMYLEIQKLKGEIDNKLN